MRHFRQLKSGFWGPADGPSPLFLSSSPPVSPRPFPRARPARHGDPPAPDELRQSTLPFDFVSSNTPLKNGPVDSDQCGRRVCTT